MSNRKIKVILDWSGGVDGTEMGLYLGDFYTVGAN